MHYALSDNAGDVTAIYTLYKEYMDVEISLENYSGKDAASAYYVREFTKKYQKVEKRSVGTWKFPENDDFHIRPLTVLPGSTDLKMVEVCTRSMKVRRHSRRII